MAVADLFKKELKVINVGLLSFKESLDKEGFKAIQVDWKLQQEEMKKLLKLLKN